MKAMTLREAANFGMIANQYLNLRADNPTARAITVKRFIDDDYGLSFEQYQCETEVGHHWSHGGEDYDRCYCMRCGADGDA